VLLAVAAAMADEKIRSRFDKYFGQSEVVVYASLGALLFITAVEAIISSGKLLWDGVRERTLSSETLHVLEQLLLVLMVIEILHTVRISIRSHVLVAEPFLIVGLIASIRRVLVISLQATTLTVNGKWVPDGVGIFNASMLELGLLGLLIMILVGSIVLMRRLTPELGSENADNEGRGVKD
jgi:uncharacterized membrane protein (DUF373 family)